MALAKRVLKAICGVWLGASIAACGSTAEMNEELVRDERKDVDIQTALSRFKDARVMMGNSGAPYFVKGRLGRLPESLGGLRADSDAARGALETIAPIFRVSAEELRLQRNSVDEQGHQHLRYQQTLHGRRVVGGEFILHVDAERNIYAANGSARLGEPSSTQARIAPEAARKQAERDSTATGATAGKHAELVYLLLAETQTPQLAYEVRVTGERDGAPAEDLVYVDAERGEVLLVNPRIHSALQRKVHTANNGTATPGTLRRSEGQAASGDNHVDTNYNRLGETYNCYKTLFGRDSINNAGIPLVSTVHYARNYVNAYWDGNQMVYGDGDNVNSIPLGLDADVTTHELTHAVTQYESNLVYAGESGGLNESVSDIFAGVCESWSRNWATDADVFKVGEDIWTPGTAGDALRYMDDPAKDGISLDSYGDYYTGVDVHYSSGISNLVFALLSKGGKHPRNKTSNPVPAIGPEKAGRIFYKANTDFFISTTTFEQARTYTLQAAESLYGAKSPEVTAVTEAWKAVGIPAAPPVLTPLENGVAVTGLTGSAGNKKYYTLEVPQGRTRLVINMSGGTGDADMFVKADAAPSTSSYDCRPYKSGNTESCSFTNPQAGTWYVMINAYSGYTGVTLKATYSGSSLDDPKGIPASETLNGTVSRNANNHHGAFDVVEGSAFEVVMTGSADPDLYVRFGAQPTTTTYHCRPFLSGAAERCVLTVPAGHSKAFLMVRGYDVAATYSLELHYTQPSN
ncbi:M4 family metallopeptidase [Melittangium boletus]|uniref:Peptidase M4 n=1 Tax=Melittangium boletus DSM 14713 TaxID=1294270 RepID=A0A250I7M8_9BACT|nr:M4 family metallopeptidase [Melittangium boletus]ATB27181.1 peptidase M4 [Melittangium boletus DSM 14713]